MREWARSERETGKRMLLERETESHQSHRRVSSSAHAHQIRRHRCFFLTKSSSTGGCHHHCCERRGRQRGGAGAGAAARCGLHRAGGRCVDRIRDGVGDGRCRAEAARAWWRHHQGARSASGGMTWALVKPHDPFDANATHLEFLHPCTHIVVK